MHIIPTIFYNITIWVSTCIFYELIFYVNDFMSQALQHWLRGIFEHQCWTKRRLGSLRPRSHWKENKLKENPESLPNMWSSLRLGYLLSSPSGRKREKINHMFDSGKFFVISSLVFQFLGGLIPTQIMDETAWRSHKKLMLKTKTQRISFLYLNLRSSEIHLFYNLGDFYWHFLEILWLFIFLFLYSMFDP